MQRKTFALLMTAATLAAITTATLLTDKVPRIHLSQDPDEADHVTLYQNGLAAVTLARSFQTEGGLRLLTFAVPTTAVFDSIRVEGAGVTVKETRSSLADRPLAQPGDQVVVHVGDKAFEGTLLSASDGTLLVKAADGTAIVQASQVTALEVKGREVRPEGPGTTQVDVLVDTPPGNHTVKLAYLARGPGWTPHYQFDVQSGAARFYATLTGLADWSGVTLDLVAGSPNVVVSGSFDVRGMNLYSTTAAPGAGLADGDGFGGSQQLGDLQKYSYKGFLDVRRGETVRLLVLEGKLETVRHYYLVNTYPTTGPVQAFETFQVRNTLGEPMPAGVVRMYQGMEWLGESNVPATGRGEQANLTAASSGEVKATVKQTQHTTDAGSYPRETRQSWTYEVTARNSRGDAVDMRVVFQYGGYATNLGSVTPEPSERRGDAVVWDFQLQPGAKVLTVSYERVN